MSQRSAANSSLTASMRGDLAPIAVVGAGAVGGYFGALLAQAGAPVVMIGREAFVGAVKGSGLLIEGRQHSFRVPVAASTEASTCADAGLVLLCVKTVDTEQTARSLAPFLREDAVIVTLQNGVDGAERLHAAIGRQAYSAVVYVAAAVAAPGHINHYGRGDLVLGPEDARTRALARLFESAGIPCRLTANIVGELWLKLLMNCALNAISALAGASYGRIAASPDARRLIEAAVSEVLEVARAAHIELPGMRDVGEAMGAVMRLITQMPDQLSSTAQDLSRGRRTEIEALNGYLSRCGAALGVPAPVNQALCALVRLREG